MNKKPILKKGQVALFKHDDVEWIVEIESFKDNNGYKEYIGRFIDNKQIPYRREISYEGSFEPNCYDEIKILKYPLGFYRNNYVESVEAVGLSESELEVMFSMLSKAVENRQVEFGWHTYQDPPYQGDISDSASVISRDIEVFLLDGSVVSVSLEKKSYDDLVE